jgi:hypothetical protein
MYLSKRVTILGFVSKPKGVRERNVLGKPDPICLKTVQLDDAKNNGWFENYMVMI